MAGSYTRGRDAVLMSTLTLVRLTLLFTVLVSAKRSKESRSVLVSSASSASSSKMSPSNGLYCGLLFSSEYEK